MSQRAMNTVKTGAPQMPSVTPRVDNIVDHLRKIKGVAKIAQQNGKDMQPADVAKNVIASRIGGLKNYLNKRGVDTSNIENQSIEDTAGQVYAEKLDEVRERIQEKESEYLNNSPVIDANTGAKISQLPSNGAPNDNTGVYYGNQNLKDNPITAERQNPIDSEYGGYMENPAYSGEFEDGVKLQPRKADDGGGYFTVSQGGGQLLYWGSGLYDPNRAFEDVLQRDEEAAGFDLDPENFLGGDILGAVIKIGQNALVKANEKREAQGKKPILKILEPNGARETTADVSEGSIFGNAAKEAVDEITKIKKQEEIKKMMPMIIIGVLVLITVVYLIARRR